MAENEGQYQFSIRLNTEQLRHDVATAQAAFNNLTQSVGRAGNNMRGATKEIDNMDNSLQKLQNSLLKVGAGLGLMQLAKQVVNVRAEFQSLEIAFGTLLGNKKKADKLMAELTELAATTPFGLQEVSQAAKQLLAFGSTAEDVSEEIIMLGDIASGLSIPLGDLIYLYGTTRTQGQLFTKDLQQFMSRGIPLAKELAEQFGVAEQEVSALVTAGEVGFEDVQKALQSLTAEGSMFGGGMQKQSEGIKGQISNIQDSIDSMFNEIGKSSEGLINMTLDGVSWMVEHWRELLNILKYVVAVYGSYKAALILVTAVQKAMAIGKSAIAFIQLATSIRKASEAMTLLNTVTKASPWGLLAAVIGTVAASFIDVAGSAEEAASGIDEVEDASDKAERTMGRLEQAAASLRDEIDELFSQILDPNTSTEQRMMLLAKLTELYPDLAKVIDLEAISTENLTKAQEEYNKAIERELTLAAARDRIKEAEAKKRKAQTDIGLAVADLMATRTHNVGYTIKGTGNKNATLRVGTTEYGVDYFVEQVDELAHRKANEYYWEAINKYIAGEKEGKDTEQLWKTLSDDLEKLYSKVEEDVRKEFFSRTKLIIPQTNLKGDVLYHDTYDMPYDGFTITDYERVLGENRNLIPYFKESVDELNKAKTEYEAALKSIKGIDPNYGVDADNLNAIINDVKSYKEEIDKLKFDLEFAQQGLNDAIEEDDSGRVSYWSERVKTAEEAYNAMAKPYENYLKKQEKLMEEERKQREKIADMNRKLMDAAAQARVDAMEDGFEKEMAQLDLNFEQEIRKIEEQEADLRKLQGGRLTKEQTEAFDALRKKATTEYADKATVVIFGTPEDYDKQLKEAEASWDEYLAEYGTFQERLAAIKRNYDRKLADAKTDGEKAAIIRERDAVLAEYEVEAQGFARNLADKTLSEIETITKTLQEEVEAKQEAYDALDSSDSDQAKALIAEIDILNAKIKALEELTGKASDNLAKDNWEGATEVFQNIADCANEAAEGLEEYDKGLAAAFTAMGKIASVGVNLAGAIKGVKTAFDAANKSVSAMEKASAILAVISVAIQAISSFVDMFKGLGGEGDVEKTTRLFKELNTEVERLREASRIDSFDGTIFGKDGFGNFNNNLAVMRDALETLEATQERIAKRGKEIVMGNGVENWGDRKVGELEWTGKSSLVIDRGQEWDSAYDSVSNMQVQTKHKTWFTRAKYSSLEELYPELFEGGELSLEALKKLQESDLYNKLSKENRDLIDELIANWQMYEDAVTATEEYLTDVFGELGNEINNAIVDAWKNGTDAAVAFGDVAGKVLENLISQIGYTAYIAPILSQAMADVENLNKQDMTPEEYLNTLMGIVGSAMTKAEAGLEDYNEYLDRVDRMAEGQGINAFNGERTAATKGIAQASQNSVDELNGRATAIQSHTSSIMESTKQLTRDTAEMLSRLAGIESNTAELRQMRLDMSAMRRDINDMATRGIVTR